MQGTAASGVPAPLTITFAGAILAASVSMGARSFAEPGMQSAFETVGRSAMAIEELTWVLVVLTATTFALVMAFTALAVWRRPDWLRRRSTILIGGFAFPVVVLTGLLVYGLFIERTVVARDSRPRLSIDVIAEQYWWRVHYREPDGTVVASANEIRIPAGVPVELRLSTRDVIHSFWVPALAGKLDMIPGVDNRLQVEAVQPGTLRGQCAEYCGGQHAHMAFYVVVMQDAEFARWLAREREPASPPATPMHERGRALFARNCARCHAIRGTEADGMEGPDLTHVGGRLSLGAGMLPNNIGTMAGWIASAQHLKPGNRMPSFRSFSGVELLALAAYLETLR